MKRVFSVALPAAALLGLAVFSVALVARNAPAFSSSLRTDSVFGDWRAVPSASLYEKGEYYLQLGQAYLYGDVATIMTGETTIVSEELFLQRISRATELFEASLAAEPGQVEAWTRLAWTNLLSGDFDDAQDALATSWALAPNNANQAPSRLSLVAALQRNEALDLTSDPTIVENALLDLEALETHRRSYFVLFSLSESAIVEDLLRVREDLDDITPP